MLFAAASPLIAALLLDGKPEIPTQICSVHGLTALPAQPAAPTRGDRAPQHCVFCMSGAWQPPVSGAFAFVFPYVRDSAWPHAGVRVQRADLRALQPLSPRAPPRP
jgi:hypothetical protein